MLDENIKKEPQASQCTYGSYKVCSTFRINNIPSVIHEHVELNIQKKEGVNRKIPIYILHLTEAFMRSQPFFRI